MTPTQETRRQNLTRFLAATASAERALRLLIRDTFDPAAPGAVDHRYLVVRYTTYTGDRTEIDDLATAPADTLPGAADLVEDHVCARTRDGYENLCLVIDLDLAAAVPYEVRHEVVFVQPPAPLRPTLRTKRETRTEVDYHELERFVIALYPVLEGYSFVALEECSNDSKHAYNLTGKLDRTDAAEWADVKSGVRELGNNRVLLEGLVADGDLAPGAYLIDVCW